MSFAVGRKANTKGQRTRKLPCLRCSHIVSVYRDADLYAFCYLCRDPKLAHETRAIAAACQAAVDARLAHLALCRSSEDWARFHAAQAEAWERVTAERLASQRVAS